LQRGLNFLDAIGSWRSLPFDGFPFGFALGFWRKRTFSFFFLAEVEEVCAAPGWLAADAAGAALMRSAAPKIDNIFRLLIVSSTFRSQFDLLLRRWNDPGQINRVELVAARPPHDLEQHIRARLQTRNRAAILGHGIHRGVVDFGNDVAASEAHILGKAGRVDGSDQRTFMFSYPARFARSVPRSSRRRPNSAGVGPLSFPPPFAVRSGKSLVRSATVMEAS